MPTITQPQREQPPYSRWFCYLLLAAILTVVRPYFESPETRYYSPSIGTYVETPSGMIPTTMKIYLDGRTYGELEASWWTKLGLVYVGIEALIFTLRRLRK
jgi:hypothetical protein